MHVFVFGAGKVGRALARALRRRGVETRLRSARRGVPRAIEADLVVLAVRDRDVRPLAEDLARRRVVPLRAAVVHVAGALDAGALEPLRGRCAGVAQMHPLVSFASPSSAPRLEGASMHVQGDAPAVARARRLAHRLGMTPWTFPDLDAVAYHAAAGLVANGATALAAVGAEVLVRAGVPREVAPRMLGALLRSVAENVTVLGFPEALTGPVRRGDVGALERHLGFLRAKVPRALPLYLAAAAAQLPLARAIGDAPSESFDAIARSLSAAARAIVGESRTGRSEDQKAR